MKNMRPHTQNKMAVRIPLEDVGYGYDIRTWQRRRALPTEHVHTVFSNGLVRNSQQPDGFFILVPKEKVLAFAPKAESVALVSRKTAIEKDSSQPLTYFFVNGSCVEPYTYCIARDPRFYKFLKKRLQPESMIDSIKI